MRIETNKPRACPREARQNPAAASRCHGYSLLELLVVTVVMIVGLNLCASLASTGMRMTAVNTLALDRLQGLSELQGQFAEAVRDAVAVVPSVGELRTGPDKVVFTLPPVDGRNRWMVIGDLNGHSRLMKGIVSEGSEGLKVDYGSSFGPTLASIQFSLGDVPIESVRLVALDVTVKQERGERPIAVPPHRYLAALRGL